MPQSCPKCGAVNREYAQACDVCQVQLVPGTSPPELVTGTPREPEWRQEVVHRLEAYRARRRRLHPDDSQGRQGDFPFSEVRAGPDPECAPKRRTSGPLSRPEKTERVELEITQSAFPFSVTADPALHPNAGLVPVATLRARAQAGLLDALFLVLAYVGFLGLFRYLGGQFSFSKPDAVVCVVAFFLFYAHYFALFTSLGGSTPGMRLCGLCVVRFDGSLPSTVQLLWRSFGYLVSGGTIFLGFLWSVGDEDRLTWHDRISQTYISAAALIRSSPDFRGN